MPGQPLFEAIVSAFGRQIVGEDGRIDRRRLGAIVFSDHKERDGLEEILNTAIVVVNKPGAFMTVGTDAVAKARKDGYTLLYGPATGITYSKALDPEHVPYDPIKDLEPLGLHAFFPVVIAVPSSSPWKNLNELIEDAKAPRENNLTIIFCGWERARNSNRRKVPPA